MFLVGGGGFNANSSTVGGQGEQINKDGVLPVVLRQLQMVEENVEMFGLNYALIEIVALVRGVEYSSTKVTYNLEDHTGQIDAFFWIEENDQVNQPQLATNCYARIVGSLRTSGESKVVIVYHAEEVTDPNVVTAHNLEVLYVRFKAEAYKKRGVRATYNNTFGGVAIINPSTHEQPSSTTGFDNQSNSYGLNPKHLLIYKLIKENGGSTGLNRKELERKCSHISKTEMEAALEFMVTEGIIYTTIDADHYLSVE